MKNTTFFLTLLVLFLISFNVKGQGTQPNVSKCNCQKVFDELIWKVESNYIGLELMRRKGDLKDYDARIKEYRLKSAHVLPKNCAEFLDQFLNYFNDGHLHVLERPDYTESELKQFRDSIKAAKLDHHQLMQQALFMKRREGAEREDCITGTWTDGVSTFVIIEENSAYKAYILETTKEGVSAGELKAILRPEDNKLLCKYYSYSYSPVYIRGNIYKDGQMFVAGHVFWQRVSPAYRLRENAIVDLKNTTMEILNPSTTLVTIPSFNMAYKDFDEFVKMHESQINNSKNLIIDIRGNRGGNGIYFPLIELYAEQNKPSSQGLVLASEDNLNYFERQSKNSRGIYRPVAKRLKGRFGEIVDGPLYPEKKFKAHRNSIKNVAILTDHGSASAAESFVLHSKSVNDNVRTFGSSTAGMIDYTSVNIISLESGSQNIYLAYPTSTLHKEIPEKGYNANGIIPDNPIVNNIQDKVGFIVDYYRE